MHAERGTFIGIPRRTYPMTICKLVNAFRTIEAAKRSETHHQGRDHVEGDDADDLELAAHRCKVTVGVEVDGID
jgi:hypothetical protein